jgi:general stress protein 26
MKLMDSINNNQPEETKANLSEAAALIKIKELIKQTDTCFFCTQTENGPSNGVRPMSVQEVDDEGNLWMLLANDSYTYKEVLTDSNVKLYFQGSKHSDFLYIKAKALIVGDREKISKLWSPFLKVWFTEGENDPRIALMKITPEDGYYWDNKHGNVVAGIKMLIGAAIGQTLDDSIEGEIKI